MINNLWNKQEHYFFLFLFWHAVLFVCCMFLTKVILQAGQISLIFFFTSGSVLFLLVVFILQVWLIRIFIAWWQRKREGPLTIICSNTITQSGEWKLSSQWFCSPVKDIILTTLSSPFYQCHFCSVFGLGINWCVAVLPSVRLTCCLMRPGSKSSSNSAVPSSALLEEDTKMKTIDNSTITLHKWPLSETKLMSIFTMCTK